MTQLILAAEHYLKENIDDHVAIKPLHKKNKLPIFLKNIYKFYEMTILGTTCIMMEVLDETPGIDVIKKHIKKVKELMNQQIVLYYKEITRYRRKSLIENRIPFLIEDGQMFFPFLGMDLKRAPQHVEKKKPTFSTSAQLAYLYFMYNKELGINTTELAGRLGLSVMSASRALNELYNTNLITYEVGGKTGRSKEYHRIPDPEFFNRGKDFIKYPVKKLVYVKKAPKGTLMAGLDALAELSMINPPDYQVRAIGIDKYNKENSKVVRNKDLIKDEKLVELQIWSYEPQLFTNKKHVDIMSLYASLKDENDERIEQALDEVLQGEKWYMD